MAVGKAGSLVSLVRSRRNMTDNVDLENMNDSNPIIITIIIVVLVVQ